MGETPSYDVARPCRLAGDLGQPGVAWAPRLDLLVILVLRLCSANHQTPAPGLRPGRYDTARHVTG